MGWGTNKKALAKRQKQQTQKKIRQQEQAETKEKKKWQDEYTDKKMETAKQRQERRVKQLERKRILKEMAKKQEEEMEKINKKKGMFAQPKLTQAQIAENLAKDAAKNKQTESDQKQFFKQENSNRQFEGYEVANNVEQALNALNFQEEKHPQKRVKAAFEAYCAKIQQVLKIKYPKLKRSQRMQMMHKEFEKCQDNPFNKNIREYNYKPNREKDEQKEENGEKEKEVGMGEQEIN